MQPTHPTADEGMRSSILAHDVFFQPWNDEVNNITPAIGIAQALAHELKLPLRVAAPTLNAIPDELSKADYVTERSRRGSSGPHLTLVLHPWLRMATTVLRGRPVVVAEHFAFPLRVWAANVSALDLESGETLSPKPLTPEVVELLGRIDWNGNNGWMDAPGKRDAIRDLTKLKDFGALDAEVVVAAMLVKHSETHIKQLVKLIEKVDGKPASGAVF